jgi:hypothetical protein
LQQTGDVATSIEGRNATDSVAGEGEKNENQDGGDIQVKDGKEEEVPKQVTLVCDLVIY